MSETDSSDSDRVDVAPRSAGRACHGKNTRSLSWQPADDYYASACNTPNSSGANYYTEKDLPALENLHRELLADNFRLWECVNIVRCNPGLMASHVLKHLFSQEDHEFYASYPSNRPLSLSLLSVCFCLSVCRSVSVCLSVSPPPPHLDRPVLM